MSAEHFAMLCCGFLVGWATCRSVGLSPAQLRNSNPPPPGKKPQPPQPLAARLIRWWIWEVEQIRQAFEQGRMSRDNGNCTPTTPRPLAYRVKPPFPQSRIIGPDGETVGYRSINYPDPSPDRRPTNPYTGKRIPDQPPHQP